MSGFVLPYVVSGFVLPYVVSGFSRTSTEGPDRPPKGGHYYESGTVAEHARPSIVAFTSTRSAVTTRCVLPPIHFPSPSTNDADCSVRRNGSTLPPQSPTAPAFLVRSTRRGRG